MNDTPETPEGPADPNFDRRERPDRGAEFGPRRRGGRGRPEGMPPRGRGHHRGFGGDGFPRAHRARRGDVRAAVLSLLSQEPQNGYRLMKSFRDATDGAWRPSPGSIYPTLTQLVEEGLIVSVGEGRQTEFELTDTGRAYVAEHAEELDKAWASATGHSEQDLAFQGSVAKLNGAIEQFALAASDEQRISGGKAIDDARRALYLILAE